MQRDIFLRFGEFLGLSHILTCLECVLSDNHSLGTDYDIVKWLKESTKSQNEYINKVCKSFDNKSRDQVVRAMMLGKELLYNHDNSLVRLKRLSKSDSASHVTILVSGFLSEADTGLEWVDALSADPTQTF